MQHAETLAVGVDRLEQLLKDNFGLASFRPSQLDAIQATIAGHDTLVILPTGGGKSLTFQLPCFTKDYGITIVVSPLLALMKEQVEKCNERGIDAQAWSSDVNEDARCRIISELRCDEPSLRLLYTTPESVKSERLREAIKEAYQLNTLYSFAVDEAHCVSEWGHDFRPAYLELHTLKDDFPNTPITALTASCTARIEKSIVEALRLRMPIYVRSSFNRPNIAYQVRPKELIGNGSDADVLQDLVEFIQQMQGSCGIVYARLRATCDWLARELGEHDLEVAAYHAGKDSGTRARIQRDWSEGAVNICIATVAFGMGIDRADVRWVVHWDAPASQEGLYQVVYCSHSSLAEMHKMERGNRRGSVAEVETWCTAPGCRRKRLLAYFGEKRTGGCDASVECPCDFCTDPKAVTRSLLQLDKALEQKSVAAAMRAHMALMGAPGQPDDIHLHEMDCCAGPRGMTSPRIDRATHIVAKGGPGDSTGGGVATGGGMGTGRQKRKTAVDPWATAQALDAVSSASANFSCHNRDNRPLVSGTGVATAGACATSLYSSGTEAVGMPEVVPALPRAPAVKPVLKRARGPPAGFVAPRLMPQADKPAAELIATLSASLMAPACATSVSPEAAEAAAAAVGVLPERMGMTAAACDTRPPSGVDSGPAGAITAAVLGAAAGSQDKDDGAAQMAADSETVQHGEVQLLDSARTAPCVIKRTGVMLRRPRKPSQQQAGCTAGIRTGSRQDAVQASTHIQEEQQAPTPARRRSHSTSSRVHSIADQERQDVQRVDSTSEFASNDIAVVVAAAAGGEEVRAAIVTGVYLCDGPTHARGSSSAADRGQAVVLGRKGFKVPFKK